MEAAAWKKVEEAVERGKDWAREEIGKNTPESRAKNPNPESPNQAFKDGFSVKSGAAVGSDLRVFLSGLNLVGKVEVEAVLDVPSVHGSLREAVKAMHSRVRIEFNSGVRGGKERNRKAWSVVLMPLAMALRDLGASSLGRAKLNLCESSFVY
ncbi:hypothetical protein Droror1_Dr00024187 [Drosera rotundifolia]